MPTNRTMDDPAFTRMMHQPLPVPDSRTRQFFRSPSPPQVAEIDSKAAEADRPAADISNNSVQLQVAELPDRLTDPVAYHLRFTFSNQDKDLACLEDKQFISRCKVIHKNVIKEFLKLQYIYEDRYTSGFETHNKKGETCPAHFHLIFYSTKNTETMRRKVKRYLNDVYDQEVVGNKALMFKPQVVRSKTELCIDLHIYIEVLKTL